MTGPRGPQGEGYSGPKVMDYHFYLNSSSISNLFAYTENVFFFGSGGPGVTGREGNERHKRRHG